MSAAPASAGGHNTPMTPPPGYQLAGSTHRTSRSVWGHLNLDTVKELIDLGGNMRPISGSSVSVLLAEMLAGRFEWEAEPIAYVSDSDKLINGNHRLHALKRFLEGGGQPPFVEVRYDCPDRWSHVFDAGRRRTKTQRAASLGFSDANDTGSCFTGLWNVAHSGDVTSSFPMPASLMEDILGGDPTVRDIVDTAVSRWRRMQDALRRLGGVTGRGMFPSASAATALALMEVQDPERTEQFVQDFLDSIAYAPMTNSTGGAAACGLIRDSRHLNVADAARTGHRRRAFAAMMLAFETPPVRCGVLCHRLLHRNLEKRAERAASVTREHAADWVLLAAPFFGDRL